jgi:hypothetical protein
MNKIAGKKYDFSTQYIESFEYYIEKANRLGLITERGDVDAKVATANNKQQVTISYSNKNIDFKIIQNGKQLPDDKNIDSAVSNMLNGSYVINPPAPYPTENNFIKIPVADIQKTLLSNISKKVPTVKSVSIQTQEQDILVSNVVPEFSLTQVVLDATNKIGSLTFAYMKPNK